MTLTENYTEEEMDAINQLRKRMGKLLSEDKLQDDFLFYRFLKARDFKLDLAEEMLKLDISWRMQHQIDSIISQWKAIEVLEKYFSSNFIGFDKEGCVVRYLETGKVDLEGIFKSVTATEFRMHSIFLLECDICRLKEQSQKIGRRVSQFVYIMDLEGLTLGKALDRLTLNVSRGYIRTVQDHYPERLKMTILINSPVYFSLMFSILKTVMSDSLLRKTKIFGTDGWKEALLDIIDADTLPAFLGGKKTDDDGNPFCTSIIKNVSPVPEIYFKDEKELRLMKMPDAEKSIIPASSETDVSVHVQKQHSLINWVYQVKHGDIGFCILFSGIESSSERVEVIPMQRTHDYEGPQDGIYKCERIGTYYFVFDNSHSWLKQKEVYYRIRVSQQ